MGVVRTVPGGRLHDDRHDDDDAAADHVFSYVFHPMHDARVYFKVTTTAI